VLPETRAALSTGTICPARAHAVVTGTAGLTPEQARWVDTHLAEELPRLDPPGARRKVRTLIARLEVDATRRRVRYETCRRRVLVQPLGDGAAELVATGPVADITALFHRITTWATTRTGPRSSADPHAAVAAGLDPVVTDPTGLPDRRGVDARRFDALVGLGTGTGADAREDGRAHSGPCTGPSLSISISTLLGLDDEQGSLAGHGAVPADVARELLAAGHPYRRVLTDPWTGTVLGVDGHLHHLPAPATRTPTTTRVADDAPARSSEGRPAPAASEVSDMHPAVAPPATAPPPMTPAPVADADPVLDLPDDGRTGTPPAPPPATTAQMPPGLTDKLARIADGVTPGTTTPGTTTPPWARAGDGASDEATPRASTCPLAGLPTDYVPTTE
jgi:hypothetical protein